MNTYIWHICFYTMIFPHPEWYLLVTCNNCTFKVFWIVFLSLCSLPLCSSITVSQFLILCLSFFSAVIVVVICVQCTQCLTVSGMFHRCASLIYNNKYSKSPKPSLTCLADWWENIQSCTLHFCSLSLALANVAILRACCVMLLSTVWTRLFCRAAALSHCLKANY